MINKNKESYNTDMKVAIIGYGFVGEATHKGLKKDLQTLLIDPKLGNSTKDLKGFEADFIFVCVPTPMANDGSIDDSILKSVLTDLDKYCLNSTIILKSTITPNIINEIIKNRPNMVYNPEFLRERTANEDFINSKMIIFGGNEESFNKASMFYKNHTNCLSKKYQFMPADKASLIKYTINSFLALKVLFFNEIFKVFDSLDENMEWEDFINIIKIDERMGDSHMQVPGPDGRFGFGGACFPKDTKAFLNFSKNINAKLKLIEKSISLNNKIRSKYKTLDEREKQQNVHFI